jgi:hypothetical protein
VTAVTAIPIELIRIDGGTQIRDCKTQHTKVEEYVAAMATGADFPPLTVFWDGAEYWLADGFHRLWAYNIVMQALKLPGMNLPCEVIEGTQRDAIMFACGVNSAHGMPRTVPDKQSAVRTTLKNPLVALNEDGTPWNDSQIGRICKVDPKMVGRHRADLAAEAAKPQDSGGSHLRHAEDSGERKVTRGGTTYTMKTANIGPKTEPATKADGLSASEAKTPIVVVEPAKVEPAKPVPPPEAKPEPEPEPAKVVEFKSKWDFIYEHLAEIDRAIEALPAPDVAAAKFPETLAQSLTVERCLEIQRWVQDFTRYWAARNPGIKRRHPDFFEEDQSVSAD